MVATQKRIKRQALKLSVAAFALTCFGVAVVAAPFTIGVSGFTATTQAATLSPLASGPAIQLARAGAGESEDCVRVTKMTGPDGKVYPTRGIVCGGPD